MPGHSLIGKVATLDSSSVTCPENPGSMNPAVEWVTSPSLPNELLWVGTNVRPTKNIPLAAATWMQRTGTDNLPILTQPVQPSPSHDYSQLTTPSVWHNGRTAAAKVGPDANQTNIWALR